MTHRTLPLVAIPLLAFACSPNAPMKPQQPPEPLSAVVLPPLDVPATQPTTAPTTAASTQPAVRSPEVSADRRVTFRVAAPKEAKSVAVQIVLITGAVTLPMTREGNVWSVTTAPMTSDLYEYAFVIDKVKTLDPSGNWIKDRNNSLVMIPASPPEAWDDRPVPHGVLRVHVYESKSLGDARRRLHVYTPPGYDYPQNVNTRYPILYLLHGSGDDDAGWSNVGRANAIFDNLIADGKMKPTVVVMPYGHVPRQAGAAAQPDYVRAFEKDLIGDVMPLVESSYRVYTDTPHRAIAGLSMGGAQSLRIGLAHLDRFGWICSMSAGRVKNEDLAAIPNLASAANKLKLLWISCGEKDGLLKPNKENDAWLTEHGIKHEFHVTPGIHTWLVWRRNLVEVSGKLFQESPKAE